MDSSAANLTNCNNLYISWHALTLTLSSPILHVLSDTGGFILFSCRPSFTAHLILCRTECHACKHFVVCQACTSNFGILCHVLVADHHSQLTASYTMLSIMHVHNSFCVKHALAVLDNQTMLPVLPKVVWCSHRFCSWRKTIQSTKQSTEQ